MVERYLFLFVNVQGLPGFQEFPEFSSSQLLGQSVNSFGFMGFGRSDLGLEEFVRKISLLGLPLHQWLVGFFYTGTFRVRPNALICRPGRSVFFVRHRSRTLQSIRFFFMLL